MKTSLPGALVLGGMTVANATEAVPLTEAQLDTVIAGVQWGSYQDTYPTKKEAQTAAKDLKRQGYKIDAIVKY